MSDFNKRYLEVWETFTTQISLITKDLVNVDVSEQANNLHDILKEMQWVPYHTAPKMFSSLNISEKRSNIGSVTGVFFELIVASVVTGAVRNHLPEAEISFNSWVRNDTLKDTINRDPDIFIHYRGRYVVFETKVSPKQNDINHAKWLREKCIAQKNVEFYLIGGYVSANADSIESVQGWACFTDSSERNKNLIEQFRFDDILNKAIHFLSLAE